jgi:hypothetical protein
MIHNKPLSIAEKFTAMFMGQMAGHLFDGKETSHHENLFASFLHDALGQHLARSPAGEKITQNINATLIRLQGENHESSRHLSMDGQFPHVLQGRKPGSRPYKNP